MERWDLEFGSNTTEIFENSLKNLKTHRKKFQWVFTFFSSVWKPNSKSHLSAAWCLLLTPRHEPLGWLAITVFDWRKTSVWKNCGVWVIPSLQHGDLTTYVGSLCSTFFIIYYNTVFVFSLVTPDFVGSISFWIYSTTTAKIWASFQNLSEFSKFEWGFKIWVSIQNLSEF